MCGHYKDGGVTTSQLCFTITNLIARLWVLTHQTVGVLAASGALELKVGLLRTGSESGTH